MRPDGIGLPAADAPILQALVTLGLTLLLAHLYRRHQKAHFLWWAAALAARVLSVGAIIAFLATGWEPWLFLHQVFIGWTALGFLYAAEVFSRQLRWQPRFWGLVAFPVVWSAIAIFGLEEFALAAGPAVLFLAMATARAGIVFRRYRRRTGSPAAGALAGVLLLWSLHHLDYPILRARGAWDPWGYYLDILFVLAMGAGVVALVLEEQREAIGTLTALSGAARVDAPGDARRALLEGPIGLRGVRGTALVRLEGDGVRLEGTAGEAAGWERTGIPAGVGRLAIEVAHGGRPRLEGHAAPTGGEPPFTAILPLGRHGGTPVVLAIVGDLAAPFAALDDSILTAVGEQIGLALERADLTARLAVRSAELEELSTRMLQEQDAQRRRLGRELHDETAQVFSALKLQLGALRDDAAPVSRPRFDRLLDWVDRGSASIRRVTDGLRPAMLDDLGLVPAVRALVADVREGTDLSIDVTVDETLTTARPALASGAEIALFRALQEALSNVIRHAAARVVQVRLAPAGDAVRLTVSDDGVVRDVAQIERFFGPGRSGLIGMRERVHATGGQLTLSTDGHGLRVTLTVPRPTR